MDITDYNNKDLDDIAFQIPEIPIKIAGVMERCAYGYPSIVLLYPERDNDDSTSDIMDHSDLLWLTCPYMIDKIKGLEDEGYIKKISTLIMADRDIEAQMKEAHADYYYLRKKIFRLFLGGIHSIDDNNKVFFSGIGGIRNISILNCLHQHYAHYRICEDNVAGRVVHTLLKGIVNCKERLCDHG